MIEIEVELFAGPREAAGADALTVRCDDATLEAADVDAAAATITVRQFKAMLQKQHPVLRPYVDRSRLAIDDQYVDDDGVMAVDCKVALIPPVSGG